jgi:hypothetical protein
LWSSQPVLQHIGIAEEADTVAGLNSDDGFADYPEYSGLGYLLNQNMLKYDDAVTEAGYDGDLPRDTCGRAKAAMTEIPDDRDSR